MSRYFTPAGLGPELEAQWRSLPAAAATTSNWAVPWWPAPDIRPRGLCRTCSQPLDPVITNPPPAGCGRDRHPLCDPDSWWAPQTYAQAEAILGHQSREAA